MIAGVVNRTKPNKKLLFDWFGNRTLLDWNFSVSSISSITELNRTNRTKSTRSLRFCRAEKQNVHAGPSLACTQTLFYFSFRSFQKPPCAGGQ